MTPRLRSIARSIERGDYGALSGDGERLVFEHAAKQGISPAQLIRIWRALGESEGSTGQQGSRQANATADSDDDDEQIEDDPAAEETGIDTDCPTCKGTGKVARKDDEEDEEENDDDDRDTEDDADDDPEDDARPPASKRADRRFR